MKNIFEINAIMKEMNDCKDKVKRMLFEEGIEIAKALWDAENEKDEERVHFLRGRRTEHRRIMTALGLYNEWCNYRDKWLDSL